MINIYFVLKLIFMEKEYNTFLCSVNWFIVSEFS